MSYDLRTGQRTFYVGLSGLADGSVTEIPFRDSAGNNIKCNYFKISAVVGWKHRGARRSSCRT